VVTAKGWGDRAPGEATSHEGKRNSLSRRPREKKNVRKGNPGLAGDATERKNKRTTIKHLQGGRRVRGELERR